MGKPVEDELIYEEASGDPDDQDTCSSDHPGFP